MGSENIRFPGLTEAEVRHNRAQHGENVLTPPRRDPWWKQFLEKFNDPIIRILLIAAVLSIAIGTVEHNFTEGIAIVIAILLATGVAFLNEYKANAEFDILNKVNDDIPVKVIRNGQFSAVPRRELVVNDIVLVETGEEIPADATVLEGVGFEVDESKLTGESHPVSKMPAAEAGGLSGTYPVDQVLKGTLVADGHAILRVLHVGDKSEIGQTARVAAEDTENITPLNRQLDRLSRLIGVVAFAVAGLIFVALSARGIAQGDLVLSQPQWIFAALLLVFALLALSMVWLPVVYDGLTLLGRKKAPPRWLESGGAKGWLISLGLALLVAGGGLALLLGSGSLPADPAAWMPPKMVLEFLSYFMIAVTIIVVAVPEGLPLSVTLSLAYSMRRMIAANNLVRRMHACETIGATTVICSDKTGTLTMNRMRLQEERFSGRQPGTPLANDDLIAWSMAVNSTANLRLDLDSGEPDFLGNPTEGALLVWLHKQGIEYLSLRSRAELIRQWTFTTDRKFMGSLAHLPGHKEPQLLIKGAPEIVLERCSSGITDQDALHRELLALQQRGMRTIGFARRGYDKTVTRETRLEEVARDLHWMGFVAILDPVRPDVPPAIEECLKAGVRVKVVTGDNPETAREIGRQIRLWQEGDDEKAHALVTGPDFADWSDEEVELRVAQIKILARARPADKLRLVKALQAAGEVVAVTGDGTNDAPALNHADVGLSMGKTGTSIAKEASDIVLLDDSFASIERAILWGRAIYLNIQHFLMFQLTINVTALVIALLGPFLGIKFPLTVMQMLWVNLIMDTLAALALATEPPDPGLMRRKPRSPDEFILTRPMSRTILATGAAFILILVAMISGYLKPGDPYRLTVFFTVFVFLQVWNLFNARSFGLGRSLFRHLFQNKAFWLVGGFIVAAQVVIVQFGGAVFRTVPLTVRDWLLIIGGTSFIAWTGEIGRFLTRRKQRKEA